MFLAVLDNSTTIVRLQYSFGTAEPDGVQHAGGSAKEPLGVSRQFVRAHHAQAAVPVSSHTRIILPAMAGGRMGASPSALEST